MLFIILEPKLRYDNNTVNQSDSPMKAVDKILATIQESIETNVFLDVETDKVEIKDLSSGDNWKELYKSVCAFLNTEGGIVIVGINEKEKKYRLTGVDPLINEAKLKANCSAFKDV